MLNFYCSHCGQNIDADDSFAGMQAECPSCGNGIQVPATPASPAMPPPVQAAVPSPVAAAEKPAPRGKRFAWIATVIAFAILCRGAFPYAQDYVPGVVGGVLMALVFMVMLVLLAALPALLAGALALAFKKPFRSPLYLTYSIALLPLAVLFLLQMNSMTDSYRRSREPQAVWDKNYMGMPDTGPNEIERALQESEEIIAKTNQELEEYDRRIAAEAAAASEQEKSPVPAAETRTEAAAPASGPLSEPADAEALNELRRMDKLVVEFHMNMMRVSEAYEERMGKEKLTDLLDFGRIAADPEFRETKPRAERIVEITERAITEAVGILDDLPALYERHSIKEPFRHPGTRIYHELVISSESTFRDLWLQDFVIVDQTSAALNILKNSRDDWRMKDGRFEFDPGDNREKFMQSTNDILKSKNTKEELRQSIVRNLEIRKLIAKLPQEPAPEAKPSPSADAEIEQAKQVAANYIGTMLATSEKYDEIMKGINIPDLLDPARIAKDEDIKESRMRLARISLALDLARKRMDEDLNNLPAWFINHGIKEPLQNPDTQKASNLLIALAPMYKKYWDLELVKIDTLQTTIRYIYDHREEWDSEDAIFLLASKEEQRHYVELIDKLDLLDIEMIKLHEKILETLQGSGLF